MENADMYIAVFTTGVYGLLRQGEMTCPTTTSFDTEVHATASDVQLAAGAHGQLGKMAYRVKASKTDLGRQSQTIDIFETATLDCPVAAMRAYLAAGATEAGSPLFRHTDGTYLTRSRLATALRTALAGCGYEQTLYSTHSLRRGGCTSMAAAGVPRLIISYVGRWKSDSMERYLQIPVDERRTAAIQMAKITNEDVAARGAAGVRTDDD